MKLCILLSCFLTLLVSCGKKEADRTNEKPVIFLHYWSDDLGAGIDTMMNAFRSVNEGYSIKATGFDHESFKISIKVMLAGGNPPDLFSYWAGARTQSLVDKSYLMDIDDVWKAQKLDTVFSPLVSQACRYRDKQYVIPVTQHYVSLFYNKKMFEKEGLQPPDTWDEFLRVCQVFKDKGIVPLELGARELWPAQFWFDYLLLRTAGPEFRDSLMTAKASYSDPRVLQVMKMWKELLDKGYFNENPELLDWADGCKAVAYGEVPITLMGTWVIGLFDHDYKLKQGSDYDFLPFPVVDQTIPSTALGPIDGILLSREGDLQKGREVIAYFTDPEVQRAMSVGSGALSPSLNVVPGDDKPVQKRIHSHLQKTKNWAFNYDLATPPEIADKGLSMFGEFLKSPDRYRELLISMDKHIDSLQSK